MAVALHCLAGAGGDAGPPPPAGSNGRVAEARAAARDAVTAAGSRLAKRALRARALACARAENSSSLAARAVLCSSGLCGACRGAKAAPPGVPLGVPTFAIAMSALQRPAVWCRAVPHGPPRLFLRKASVSLPPRHAAATFGRVTRHFCNAASVCTNRIQRRATRCCPAAAPRHIGAGRTADTTIRSCYQSTLCSLSFSTPSLHFQSQGETARPLACMCGAAHRQHTPARCGRCESVYNRRCAVGGRHRLSSARASPGRVQSSHVRARAAAVTAFCAR